MNALQRILREWALRGDVSAMEARIRVEDAHACRALGLDRRGGRDRRSYDADVRREAERRVAERRIP